MSQEPMVSVVMPCLNEEEAIGPCIEKIQRTFAAEGRRTTRNIDFAATDNG